MIKYVETIANDDDILVIEIDPAVELHGLEELGADPAELDASGAQIEELGLDEAAQQALRAVTVRADQAFNRVLLTVQAVSTGFHACMRAIQPDEGTIEFGLCIKADAGVVVTKAGGEASFKVSLTWRSGQR